MTVLIHFRFPNKWNIRVEKIGEKKWRMIYEEEFEEVDEEALRASMKLIKYSFAVAENMARSVGLDIKIGEIKREGNKIIMVVEGSIEVIATMIVSEFIHLTPFGRMSIADIITTMSFVAGAVDMKKLEEMVKELIS